MLRMKDINNKKIKVLTKKTWGLGRISVMSEVSRKTENKFECFVNKTIYKKGIYLRSWKYGDKVKLFNGNHKKVSDIFIDGKVPLFKKRLYPIIEDFNNNIIWIPGLFESNDLNLTSDKVLIKWED